MNNQTAVRADRWASRRESFLLDPFPVRMGELAVSLSSARSLTGPEGHGKYVRHYLEVSEYYLEWLTPDADPNLQSELAELRQLLVQWRENWQNIWDDPVERALVAAQAGDWSQKILERSGLLDYDDWRTVFNYAQAPSPAIEEAI